MAAVVRCSKKVSDAFAGEQQATITTKIRTNKNLSMRKRCPEDMKRISLARKVVKRPDAAPGHWDGRYQATGGACCSRADSSPSSINAITAMASAAGTGFRRCRRSRRAPRRNMPGSYREC